MAKISTYQTVTPAATDLVLGTDVGSSNATKNFTAQSIADLAVVSLGDLIPTTDDTYDIGSTTAQWKDLYLKGVAYFNGSIAGTALITDVNLVGAANTNIGSTLALKTYIDAQVTASDLDFTGDDLTAINSVDLDSQNFTIAGTANEIETTTVVPSQTLTIGLTDDVTITNTLTLNNGAASASTLNIVNTGQTEISFTGTAGNTEIFSATNGAMQIGTTSATGYIQLYTNNTLRSTMAENGDMNVLQKFSVGKALTTNSLKFSVANTTGAGATTVLDTDSATVQIVDTSGGAHTFTLPSAAATGVSGMVFIFIATNAANNITVQRAGSDTIEGNTSVNILYGWSAPPYRMLVSNGVNLWSSI
tara:strand:- start:9062 stop:10147 length:1086 start_codon:yes stop_codon:yes gene_type:complete